MQSINNIVIIGAGNLAFHLGKAFYVIGKNILQVYSRSEGSATQLASLINAEAISDFNAIATTADLYIIAVADDAISEVADKLQLNDQLVVHTSGSVGMEVLSKGSNNIGVFYPLQTFSKLKDPDFTSIPICLEANSQLSLKLLKSLGEELSNQVQFVNSKQRKVLHLAAVFACNFPNLLYTAAEKLLEENDLSFEILKPLIAETADKVQQILPSQAQTGPAFRNDIKIMNQHIMMLRDHKALEEIYVMLSRIIKKQKDNEQL